MTPNHKVHRALIALLRIGLAVSMVLLGAGLIVWIASPGAAHPPMAGALFHWGTVFLAGLPPLLVLTCLIVYLRERQERCGLAALAILIITLLGLLSGRR
jgi:cytochrome bd-type quinol oxidase subunit 2